MDTLFSDAEQAGVGMYLLLFAFIVLGGIAFYMGYRVFSAILVGGVAALVVAVAAGVFP